MIKVEPVNSYYTHYTVHVAVTIAVETKEFPSWAAFMSWKEEEESNSYSCFVQPKGETETETKGTGIL